MPQLIAANRRQQLILF